MEYNERHVQIESDDESQLWNLLLCYTNSMSLKCAVELGIAEIIYRHSSAPITLPQLAASIPIPPSKTDHFRRIMRLLVNSGVFATHKFDDGDEGFLLTPISRLLVEEGENGKNLSPFIKMIVDPAFVSPCHFLGHWLKSNDGPATPFGACHGAEMWDWANRSPDFNTKFNQAMACDSKHLLSVVVDKCASAFNGLSSLIDVAGGTGSTARCIAEAFPLMNVTVLELPHVVEGLVDDRVKFVGGDMFQWIPPADAVFLKWVLHNWNDEECVKILEKCREAVSKKGGGGKVMIIDIVVNFGQDDKINKENKYFYDMLMMVLLTGKERDEHEWKLLFEAAGFTSYKNVPLIGARSLIELYP